MSTYFFQASQINVKNINKHAILDIIRFSLDPVSRAKLAEQLGISRAAVTAIVKDLLHEGIISEGTRVNQGSGRPSITLEINPQRGYVAGIDMGVSHLHMVLADLAANVIKESEQPFEISAGPHVCFEQVDILLKDMLREVGLSMDDLTAIGVDVPGPILEEDGTVLAPPIMPGWDRYPIQKNLQARWNKPVTLNNDAEMGALGEWAYGAGREYANVAYIKVGNGIGAGLIMNNRIYRGANGSAGEIGHITVVENGPQCKCGNYGCLEALAGGQAIAEQGNQIILNGTSPQLAALASQHPLTAHDVAIAARRGDLAAQRIFRRAGDYIGIGIAGLVNIFNPDIVIVGGGVAQVGDMLLEPIRQTVRRRALTAATQNLHISTALLGRRSSSMGAAVQAITLALHHIVIESRQPVKL